MLMSCMLLQTAVRARDRAAHSKQALAFAAHPERLSFAAGPCSAQACHVMRAGCLKLSLSTPPQSSLTHVRAGSAKPRVTKQGQMDRSRCRWLASSCRCLIQSAAVLCECYSRQCSRWLPLLLSLHSCAHMSVLLSSCTQ